MCKLDLKDAYLLVPIQTEDKKYLRFRYGRDIFQFNALPFGLSSAPFIFTKLCKPVINWLRSKGIRVVIYLDNYLIFGNSKKECEKNTKLTISLLTFLGFVINRKKSDLIPKNSCKFLGMIINSNEMTI